MRLADGDTAALYAQARLFAVLADGANSTQMGIYVHLAFAPHVGSAPALLTSVRRPAVLADGAAAAVLAMAPPNVMLAQGDAPTLLAHARTFAVLAMPATPRPRPKHQRSRPFLLAPVVSVADAQGFAWVIDSSAPAVQQR